MRHNLQPNSAGWLEDELPRRRDFRGSAVIFTFMAFSYNLYFFIEQFGYIDLMMQ